LGESFVVDSDDALLRILLVHEHSVFLHYPRLRFLIAALLEDLALCGRMKLLWLAVADQLAHSPPALTPELVSLIVSDFPLPFKEFHAKREAFLWRGSRNCFGVTEFHRRCDGRANILTLILDTDGNIFGDFMPVKWESRIWNWKEDDEENCSESDNSAQSSLFTLTNPYSSSA
jgi:hypothetical protein